ncbi:IscS subfamily cysteine desulfurase [Leptolyngbya cf. ectocarpi LEGE 11479]|uniref:cysteine desulfurase n=1 Tax=Leptolyngbya cf. ectocarpi LEGE 11479 TaxID=1828722 RepID=A0A928X4C7_LEPEC|nr:IscS subfamily cysteine desulfurase [Leptolyngbya ectocarpi]MBE9066918.1 IscS subfamily cysteine desulfurase [Leptolyngbya cf. ectocarpi LEGE 11479]
MAELPIYLDCHATTPVDSRVVDAMLPFFTEYFGNPSSLHRYGWQADAAVKKSRETIAKMINAQPGEIVFTSGATEANNLAIKGVAEAYFSHGKHIVTVQTEHSAVLDPCRYLESLGFEVTYLPVEADGLLSLATLERAMRPETILVSVMTANNEIGVLQPLKEIGALCQERDILLHTDAAQAIGKIPLDVQAMNIHLMSMTAHKLYGPKGIGALYVRRRQPRVNLAAQLHGGGHERGMRSGTLYPPQIVGFGKAIELAGAEMGSEAERLAGLRSHLLTHLNQLPDIYLNGHASQRLPGNLNVSFGGVDGQNLLLALQPIVALSSGSACSAASTAPSHVLKALGRSDRLAYASLRFGLGRFTTESEIERVGQAVVDAVKALRMV